MNYNLNQDEDSKIITTSEIQLNKTETKTELTNKELIDSHSIFIHIKIENFVNNNQVKIKKNEEEKSSPTTDISIESWHENNTIYKDKIKELTSIEQESNKSFTERSEKGFNYI